MKRIAVMACAVLGLALSTGQCHASWGSLCYSGYQPWWNIFAKRYKCLTPEEERLQKFWHDYYDAMKCFYCSLDHIDWVAYYKNHGYQINANCGGAGGCNRINYAPVFVNPTIQWAVPAGGTGGPPGGPPYGQGGPGCQNPNMPMGPMGPYGAAVPYGPTGAPYGPMGAMNGPYGPYGSMAGPGPTMGGPGSMLPPGATPLPSPTTGGAAGGGQ